MTDTTPTPGIPEPHAADQAAAAAFVKGLFKPFESESDEVQQPDTTKNQPNAADIQLAAIRSRIAEKHALRAEDAAVLLTQTDEESMDAHAALLAERFPQLLTRVPLTHGNVAPKEGSIPKPGRDDSMRGFVNDLFGWRD
jgi:hypothetical protein